jgi:hypothetical protein
VAFTVVRQLTNRQVDDGPSKAADAGLMKSLGRLIKRWRSRVRARRSLEQLDQRELSEFTELGSLPWELERELARRRCDH